ncbi:hypothetical protein ACFLWR_04860 [Chloroflexota bacterium]
MRAFLFGLILLLLVTVNACGGDIPATTPEDVEKPSGSTEVEEPSAEEFMRSAIEALSGLNISDLEVDQSNVSIYYEPSSDENEAELLERWLDLAALAMSFSEQPQTITMISKTGGTISATAIIDSGDIASWILGEISTETLTSRIRIE